MHDRLRPSTLYLFLSNVPWWRAQTRFETWYCGVGRVFNLWETFCICEPKCKEWWNERRANTLWVIFRNWNSNGCFFETVISSMNVCITCVCFIRSWSSMLPWCQVHLHEFGFGSHLVWYCSRSTARLATIGDNGTPWNRLENSAPARRHDTQIWKSVRWSDLCSLDPRRPWVVQRLCGHHCQIPTVM